MNRTQEPRSASLCALAAAAQSYWPAAACGNSRHILLLTNWITHNLYAINLPMPAHANSLAIDVRNLEKFFPPALAGWRAFIQPLAKPTERALAGVSFSVERGECIAVMGPNGAGKSTLFRILATLILPTVRHGQHQRLRRALPRARRPPPVRLSHRRRRRFLHAPHRPRESFFFRRDE